MSKYFVVNPKVELSDKKVISEIEQRKVEHIKGVWEDREKKADEALHKKSNLKHTYGRVIIMIDVEMKNRHMFSNGLVIRRERKFNNFNFREVNPSNAIVVSAENMPEGSEVLIDYTAFHATNKIFDYDSGSADVEFYSVKEDECYAWREPKGEWNPMIDCEFGMRVFEPYKGVLEGVEHTVKKDILYVVTGHLKGNVVNTVRGSDYCIVLQGDDGKEKQILRFRHSEREGFDKEEVVCINHELTDKVNDGELLIGLTPSDATQIDQNIFT